MTDLKTKNGTLVRKKDATGKSIVKTIKDTAINTVLFLIIIVTAMAIDYFKTH
jgi:hypothetical protein